MPAEEAGKKCISLDGDADRIVYYFIDCGKCLSSLVLSFSRSLSTNQWIVCKSPAYVYYLSHLRRWHYPMTANFCSLFWLFFVAFYLEWFFKS